MKADIHPNYVDLKVTCSCGNAFDTRSTYSKGALHIEACAVCHPAFTGKKNTGPASGDRVDRFNKRFNRSAKSQDEGKDQDAA